MSRRSRPPGTPRATAQASRRWAVVGLVVLSAAALTLFAILVPLQSLLSGTPLALSFVLAAAVCGAPLVALIAARTAFAVFVVGVFALPLAVDPVLAIEAPWPWSVPALVAFALFIMSTTIRQGLRAGATTMITGVVVVVAATLLRFDVAQTEGASGVITANLIVASSCAAVSYLVAALVAARRSVAAELAREREHTALEQARRALVEERTRIARELHDVIAHSMSVIQVQASTARYRLPSIDDEVAAEFSGIAMTARTSLVEMRRMLGVLRTEDHTADLLPQHLIADIPELVATMRRAGVEIELTMPDLTAAQAAPPAVQIAAFRITQEALSNAVRHAAGADVVVDCRLTDDSLRIDVRNAAAAGASRSAGFGFGLRGMQERAHALGGSLTAGVDDSGGWSVRAVLPLAEPGDSNTAPQRPAVSHDTDSGAGASSTDERESQ